MTEEEREKENKPLLPIFNHAGLSASNKYIDETLPPADFVEKNSQHLKQEDDLTLEGKKLKNIIIVGTKKQIMYLH